MYKDPEDAKEWQRQRRKDPKWRKKHNASCLKWLHNRIKENPQWYEKRKQARTESRRNKKRLAIKYLGGKCHDCKRKFPWYVYDLHHKNPATKSKRIIARATNSLLMLRWETLVRELKLCVLLCSNCHRIRHNE